LSRQCMWHWQEHPRGNFCICAGTGLTPPTSAPGLGAPLPRLHRDWAHPRPHLRRDWAHPLPHLHRDWAHPLHRDWAHPAHICTGTGLTPAHICKGLGCRTRPLSAGDGAMRTPVVFEYERDIAERPRLTLSGTGLAPATSAPGLGSPAATSAPALGSPLPHLHRHWARPSHICTGTGLTRCHICTCATEKGRAKSQCR
jgi:hypothetical protein